MFQRIKECFFAADYWMLCLAALLSAAGIVAIYSAGYDPSTGVVQDYYFRQIWWLSAGMCISVHIWSFYGN